MYGGWGYCGYSACKRKIDADFQSRTQWKKCMFSGDGEFIVAGSHRQHALYIWDKATGSLAKMLTGQKGETLLDIAVSHISVKAIFVVSN